MLVLTRRIEESLYFPDVGISVVVCSVDGNRVRLGITAPDNIRVFRRELFDRMDPYLVQEKPQPQGGDGNGRAD